VQKGIVNDSPLILADLDAERQETSDERDKATHQNARSRAPAHLCITEQWRKKLPHPSFPASIQLEELWELPIQYTRVGSLFEKTMCIKIPLIPQACTLFMGLFTVTLPAARRKKKKSNRQQWCRSYHLKVASTSSSEVESHMSNIYLLGGFGLKTLRFQILALWHSCRHVQRIKKNDTST